jgi:uncharacterized protein
MKSNFQYFKGSVFFAIACIVIAYIYGGPKAAAIAMFLGVLETSLSFDNAVVNATVLKNWNERWRQLFLTVGMIIAVFGMRLVFPILIVQVTADMGFMEAANLAFTQPDLYASKVTEAHLQIAGFGGAFLMLVFLKYFIDTEKDVHWIEIIEKPLSRVGRMDMFEALFTGGVVYGFSRLIGDATAAHNFFMAGMAGIATYIIVDGVGALFEGEESDGSTAATVGKQGVAGFLYLEVLDASFSFDGVIASFVLTNNIIIIALGLGIGAMFVRSMTIFLVEKDTLSEFKYLEHGAFWAIGALAFIMLASVKFHIPEVVTGLLGVGLVILAVRSSIKHRKNELPHTA